MNSRHLTLTVRWVAIAAFLVAVFPLSASAAPVESSLPVEVSSGETEPPPASTEVQECTTNADGKPVPELGNMSEPQITKIEGGGRKYSYAISGLPEDEYMTVSEPPKGFEPLKASNAELETWGFPPRPANGSGMEEWRELVGGYQEANVSPGCTKPAQVPTTEGSKQSRNWAGYEATQPSNPFKWHAVIGHYYQTYDHGSCSPEAAEASWVGLGGVNSDSFIQTGTTTLANGATFAWIFFFASNGWHEGYVIPGFPVYAQDYMEVYAGYNYGAEEAIFYDTNAATGQTILTQLHLGHQFYDGSTAEWIDEAPGYEYAPNKYTPYPLLNFGEITWWNNTAQNEANEVLPIESLQNERISMVNGRRHLASPSALWNLSLFSEYYYNCN